MPETQSFRNHARVRPEFHFFAFFTLLISVIWMAYRVYREPSADSVIALLVSVALLVVIFSLRVQVLTVQDRVIRLEMQLRLARVLKPDLFAEASRLTVPQLVALRFACDAELPALVRDVLDGKLATQKEIKMKVQSWQGDYLRA